MHMARKRLPASIDAHPTTLLEILTPLAPYQAEIQGVVVQSTYIWYWLVDGLMMEAGYLVHLAIPAAVPQYSGLQYRMAEKGQEGSLTVAAFRSNE
jgi:hypothetical protein